MVDWFRGFGDIPGVEFEGSPGVDRRQLPGHDAAPELHVFELEGRRRESLWWPAPGGGGSASPVHHRAFGDSRDLPTSRLLKNVYEGLELPGEPSDYHFLIQGCANELWGRRRQEPEVLEKVERLCWLDIRLIEARLDAVSDEFSDEPRFYQVLAFAILINMYEREGFLHEALDVAERAARFGQVNEAQDRLLERIAAAEAEDAE